MEIKLSECIAGFGERLKNWEFFSPVSYPVDMGKTTEFVYSLMDRYIKDGSLSSERFDVFESSLLMLSRTCIHYIQMHTLDTSMCRVKALGDVLDGITKVIEDKNNDYGNAVYNDPCLAPGISVPTAILVRLSDKFRRFDSLTNIPSKVQSESLLDTVFDIVGYCILLWSWRYTEENQKDSQSVGDSDSSDGAVAEELSNITISSD